MNKTILAVCVFSSLLLSFQMTEAKHKHHKVFNKIKCMLMVPPPPSGLAGHIMRSPEESMTFKDMCAIVALDHTLETASTKEEAISQAWEIAESMDKGRNVK